MVISNTIASIVIIFYAIYGAISMIKDMWESKWLEKLIKKLKISDKEMGDKR
jgi:hypothetical protein